MKKFNKKALALIASVALSTVLSGQAHAGAKAYSHLLIDNLVALDSNGNQFDVSDFTTLDIGNFSNTGAGTILHGSVSNDSQLGGTLDTTMGSGNADDNASCVGEGCDYEDEYFMQGAPGHSFMRGDTEFYGGLVTGLVGVTGTDQDHVTANALSEGQTSVTDAGSGNGDVGTGTLVNFSGLDDSVTFEFDAEAMLEVLLHQDDVDAFAALNFSITIFNNTTNTEVFAFAPVELNENRTQLIEGSSGYDFAGSFSVTSGILSASDTYTLSIDQTTRSRFNAVKVSEPATLALFGMALMGLAAVSRRRKPGRTA